MQISLMSSQYFFNAPRKAHNKTLVKQTRETLFGNFSRAFREPTPAHCLTEIVLIGEVSMHIQTQNPQNWD